MSSLLPDSYASGTFICNLPFNQSKIPADTRVSIVEEECAQPTNSIQLNINVDNGSYESDFMLCLTGPVKGYYKNSEQFVWHDNVASLLDSIEQSKLNNIYIVVQIVNLLQTDCH